MPTDTMFPGSLLLTLLTQRKLLQFTRDFCEAAPQDLFIVAGHRFGLQTAQAIQELQMLLMQLLLFVAKLSLFLFNAWHHGRDSRRDRGRFRHQNRLQNGLCGCSLKGHP